MKWLSWILTQNSLYDALQKMSDIKIWFGLSFNLKLWENCTRQKDRKNAYFSFHLFNKLQWIESGNVNAVGCSGGARIFCSALRARRYNMFRFCAGSRPLPQEAPEDPRRQKRGCVKLDGDRETWSGNSGSGHGNKSRVLTATEPRGWRMVLKDISTKIKTAVALIG